MKYADTRPYADPEKAARKLLEIANTEAAQDGRIYIEKINGPFLFKEGGSPAECMAGLELAIARAGSGNTSPGHTSNSRRLGPIWETTD
jgi:hypothetical protein